MDGTYERFILIQMCPDALEEHLKRYTKEWPTYQEVKNEIFDYLARTAKTASRPKAGALHEFSGTSYSEASQDEGEELELDDEDREWVAMIPEEHHGLFAAFVKNKMTKKGKGNGKNKGKKGDDGGSSQARAGKGPGPENKCHECGSDQHFKRDCPVYQARMEGKSRSKGDKGQWPTQRAWGQMYPGPSKGTWGGWWPGHKGGKDGKGGKPSGGVAALSQWDAFQQANGFNLSMVTSRQPSPAEASITFGDGKKWTMQRPTAWRKAREL
jgi:hypothetical protein